MDIESQRKYDNTSLNNHGLPVKQRCDKLSSAWTNIRLFQIECVTNQNIVMFAIYIMQDMAWFL